MPYSNFTLAAFADESDNKFSGQTDALCRNRLDAIEMRNLDGKNVVALSNAEAKEYKNQLEEKGLFVWSLGSPLGKIKITDDFAPHLDSFKRGMEIGGILGASACRMFSFYMPDEKDPADYKNEVIDRLGAFCEIAKDYNIVLCHENEKGIFGDIPSRCLEIHKALPSLKAVFDPANFVQCGVDTLAAFEALSPYVYYLHIKDAKREGDIVPAGEGDGNIKKIIELYKNQGGKVLTLEPHLFEFDGLKGLEKEGNTSEVGGYNFATAEEAFDAAVSALKNII
jgi:sugar phosphate isomerase/epimerase